MSQSQATQRAPCAPGRPPHAARMRTCCGAFIRTDSSPAPAPVPHPLPGMVRACLSRPPRLRVLSARISSLGGGRRRASGGRREDGGEGQERARPLQRRAARAGDAVRPTSVGVAPDASRPTFSHTFAWGVSAPPGQRAPAGMRGWPQPPQPAHPHSGPPNCLSLAQSTIHGPCCRLCLLVVWERERRRICRMPCYRVSICVGRKRPTWRSVGGGDSRVQSVCVRCVRHAPPATRDELGARRESSCPTRCASVALRETVCWRSGDACVH